MKKKPPSDLVVGYLRRTNEVVLDGLTQTQKTHAGRDTRAVNYLSMEFLMGRLLANNLHNLGFCEAAQEAPG